MPLLRRLLLLLLLVRLQVAAATSAELSTNNNNNNSSGSSGKCLFYSEFTQNCRVIMRDQVQKQLRSWHTKVMAQYSRLTDQLVLLFPTPPWLESVGEIKVSFSGCMSRGEIYEMLQRPNAGTDSKRGMVYAAPGTNGSSLLATIDLHSNNRRRKSPQLNRFGVCLELWSYANGSRIRACSMSPIVDTCQVDTSAMMPRPPPPPPPLVARQYRDQLLPRPLADHLRRRFGLVANEDCCLVSCCQGDNDDIHDEDDSSRAADVGLYFAAAVCLAAILLACGVAALHSNRASCGELAGLRQRSKSSLPASRLTANCVSGAHPVGRPYLHLLTHCKAVNSGHCMATTSAAAPETRTLVSGE